MRLVVPVTTVTLESQLTAAQVGVLNRARGNRPKFDFLLQNADTTQKLFIDFEVAADNNDLFILPNGHIRITCSDLKQIQLKGESGSINVNILPLP